MDKTRAISLLTKQLNAIEKASHAGPDSPDFERWRRDSEVMLKNIFGTETDHRVRFANIHYEGYELWTGEGKSDLQAYSEGIQSAKTFLESCISEIEEFWPTADDTSKAPGDSWRSNCIRIFDRFLLVARQLRNRHSDRATLEVNDEYDVQDLLHSLLRLYFSDIRTEEWTPSYAGSSSRMDFLLKNEKAIIETKMIRVGLTQKVLGEQLLIDIEKYKKHPDCDTLLCFVYDPQGLIGNPRGIENDLKKKERPKVEVFIRPVI